jgi:hypothetical protein
VATSAGQYRPGGTSRYVGTTATAPVEVATLPATPANTQPAPTTPNTGSVPWTPPSGTSSPGTRRY